jgi:hypothetical protein
MISFFLEGGSSIIFDRSSFGNMLFG